MSSFQIDLHDLENGAVEKTFQPGADRLDDLFEDLGDQVWLVDPDDFEARVRAQLTDGTIHVSGDVHGKFGYQCGRCLADQRWEVDTDIDFVLMSEQQWSTAYAGDDEIALKEDEMNVSYYEGDLVDLSLLIREATMLELPTFARCPDDQRRECDRRYEARVGDETLDELEDQKTDLRWSPLKDLKIDDGGKVHKVDDDSPGN